MKLVKTEIEGVFIIRKIHIEDERGSFNKIYNEEFFTENELCSDFKESYYSVSHKNVIRGMHFYIPTCHHEKLINVIRGKIIDVILDLRKESLTYGKYISIELSEKDHYSLYIPKGCAHGYKSMEDDTTVVYNATKCYDSNCDFGISWNSFGFDWGIDSPIMSEKDKNLISFEEFSKINPF
ncbi:dTDP-4-dehydrorhamnose 3,5-epimerase [Ilyobacter sp.]|jgi:dTDP-4-dehydrorhamnose 3,5-epimerase|uniref:dTDP-4-dehydrorhamnose 3,5-epimerase n=1 Tax=Ilyobacter sp. TaxID=3100343 RepID=UPI00356380E5